MPDYKILYVGDPAPWFCQKSTSSENYIFDTVAGRYVVLCFYLTMDELGCNMLKIVEEQRPLFDDDKIAFFGVSIDPQDLQGQRVQASLPGVRFFWDFDGKICRLYGAAPLEGDQVRIRRLWVVLDPTLRIRAIFPIESDGGDRDQVAEYLKALPPVDRFMGFPVQAPIIVLPDLFEPDLCRHLIQLYETHGGEDSGFMREVQGKTTPLLDYGHKRRRDYTIEDEELKTILQRRVNRRVVPEILKVHQFQITRMERYIVACYDGKVGGHFRAHRDNTTKGTAHRKFALSVALNADFDGGEVSFPEYGSRSFKAPPGGAVIFSCSLLHEVSPVTRGRRYVFLPFLYDDAAAALREENNPFLDERVGEYRKDA